MTASLSSRLRLLLDSAPLARSIIEFLRKENDIAAWQLDVARLASENSPLAHVVLVVEELCISGRDDGNPFTLRRVHAGEWGLWGALDGVSAATCRTTQSTKLLAVPVQLWQQWFLFS